MLSGVAVTGSRCPRSDRLARSGSHDLGNIVVAETKMLSHECARN
jgi:hypothetical protein